jgi:hypothetical protein
LGRLDPAHPDAPSTLGFLRDLVRKNSRRPHPWRKHRDAYVEAGSFAGVLARTQSLGPSDRSDASCSPPMPMISIRSTSSRRKVLYC